MSSGDQVADKAHWYSENDTNWGVGYCLRFARSCVPAPASAYNAITAWREADYRHLTGVPPRGSMAFWSGGGAGHGHVAVSDGRGYVWTTDLVRAGRVDRVSLAYLAARWSNLDYLGWSEDVNSVRISGLLTTPVTVRLRNLFLGSDSEQDVRDFQLALRRHGYGQLNPSGATGFYGEETLAMCKAFQRAQGWAGEDADGVPGPKTIALLGLQLIT